MRSVVLETFAAFHMFGFGFPAPGYGRCYPLCRDVSVALFCPHISSHTVVCDPSICRQVRALCSEQSTHNLQLLRAGDRVLRRSEGDAEIGCWRILAIHTIFAGRVKDVPCHLRHVNDYSCHQVVRLIQMGYTSAMIELFFLRCDPAFCV